MLRLKMKKREGIKTRKIRRRNFNQMNRGVHESPAGEIYADQVTVCKCWELAKTNKYCHKSIKFNSHTACACDSVFKWHRGGNVWVQKQWVTGVRNYGNPIRFKHYLPVTLSFSLPVALLGDYRQAWFWIKFKVNCVGFVSVTVAILH